MPLLAFIVGVAYWPGIYGAPFMPRWWVIAVGLPLVSRLDPRELDPLVLSCLVGALGWGALTLVWTPHLFGGTLAWLQMLWLAAAMIAAAGTDNAERMIAALAAGVAVSSGMVLLQVAGISLVNPVGAPVGLFWNTEVFAELAAPLWVWALFRRRWVLHSAMLVPIVVCQSRVAVIVALAGALYGWRAPRRWIKPVAVLLLLLLVVVIVGGFKVPTADQRLLLWGTAVRSVTLFGRGLGWWFSAHPFPFEEYAHSDVLQAFVELGWAGLFLVVLGLIVLVRMMDRGYVAERAAFVAVAIETVVSFPLHLPANGFLVAVLAGHLAGRRAVVRKQRPQRSADRRAHARWQVNAGYRMAVDG